MITTKHLRGGAWKFPNSHCFHHPLFHRGRSQRNLLLGDVPRTLPQLGARGEIHRGLCEEPREHQGFRLHPQLFPAPALSLRLHRNPSAGPAGTGEATWFVGLGWGGAALLLFQGGATSILHPLGSWEELCIPFAPGKKLYPTGFSFLWLIFPPSLYSQHEVSAKAVAALSSLYGTNYKYGSIITTICKFWGQPRLPQNPQIPKSSLTPWLDQISHGIPTQSD